VSAPLVVDVLEELISTVVEPAAADVDANGTFPRAAVSALGEAGVLGLLSASEVGGAGGSLEDGALVVRRLAASCGSTAMVVCMHCSATAVIEQHGPVEVRQAIAAGQHLSTLAFSETGSRSHFWARWPRPRSTATRSGSTPARARSRRPVRPTRTCRAAARRRRPRARRCGWCRPTPVPVGLALLGAMEVTIDEES